MKKLGLLLHIFALLAFASHAQTADEFLKKCDAAYGKAKYADAVKQCTKAIEKRPDFEEAIMARAFAYEKLGNIDAALRDHTELIRLTGMAQFYFYRAGIYLDRGRKDEALADLSAAIQKEPAGRYAARCHYQRGLIYDERGKTAEAQADFKRTVQLNPDNKEAAARIKPEPANELLDGGPLSTAAERMVNKIFDGTGTDTAKPAEKPVTKPAPTAKAAAVSFSSAKLSEGWYRHEIMGLQIDFPVALSRDDCWVLLGGDGIVACAKIGNDISISVEYQTVEAPHAATASKAAEDFIKEHIALPSVPTQYQSEPFTINFGEAFKVTRTKSISITQDIIIRRNGRRWQLNLHNINDCNLLKDKCEGVRDTARRVIASIKFKD